MKALDLFTSKAVGRRLPKFGSVALRMLRAASNRSLRSGRNRDTARLGEASVGQDADGRGEEELLPMRLDGEVDGQLLAGGHDHTAGRHLALRRLTGEGVALLGVDGLDEERDEGIHGTCSLLGVWVNHRRSKLPEKGPLYRARLPDQYKAAIPGGR